jgi:myosin tail region-interacting protein MTI1
MAAPPFKVKAVFEYTSEHDDDLNFPIGQVITVTELEGDDWYVGEYTDVTGGKHEGLFPTNFVEKYEPEVPTRPSRPARPKQEAQQPAAAPQPQPVDEPEQEVPSVPVASKPPAPAAIVPSAAPSQDEPRSPPSAGGQSVPPSAPKSTPAEPAEPSAAPAKKAPPPVAAKSNAFKDRIAAFNQPAAAPLAPVQPGGKAPPPSGFIKKPFVAPPPSKNAYVPPTKAEPVHKPYVREEDPEIRQRQEEDRAAAEAAGFTNESAAAPAGEEEEDAPKPLTLKERMALLQKQQQEQAQRRAEATTHKKEKKVPQKQASESSADQAGYAEPESAELERVRSDATERQSGEATRERRRVPSAQPRLPEPMSPVPAPPEHEVLSDGHEADQSGAGDLTEDDAGTLGPDDSDERHVDTMRHPVAPKREPDVGDEEDTTEGDEGEEEDEVDEETRRKEELRARMARLGGGMPGMGAPFNPFGAPPPAPPKRKQQAPRERQPSAEAQQEGVQQRVPMVPVPGMQRVQSPESDTTQRVAPQDEEEDEEAAPLPPSRTSTMERGVPPPVPKGSSYTVS